MHLERHIPVLFWRRRCAASLQAQGMSGGKLVYALEDRARFGHVTVCEVIFNRQRINDSRDPRMNQKRFEFRAEDPISICQHGVIKRLYTQTIAGEKQRLPIAV